jgi:hypothetical protein
MSEHGTGKREWRFYLDDMITRCHCAPGSGLPGGPVNFLSNTVQVFR